MSGDPVPSEALLSALARAGALSTYELTPWPPAEIAALDRDALAEELRLHRNIDSGHVLAQVALLELADDADPALRAELTAAAVRQPWLAEMAHAPGTVGDALQRRVLAGLHVEDERGSLRIDWLAPHVSHHRPRMLLALTCVRDGEVRRARQEVSAPTDRALARRLADDWHAHATAALRATLAHLGEPRWAPGDIGEQLLQMLLPPNLAGRAAWLLTRGVELLREGPDRAIARAQVGEHSHVLRLIEASHEPQFSSYGLVRLRGQLEVYAGGQLRDVRESEGWDFPLLAEDYEAPAPLAETDARAAVAAWRVAMAEYFARAVELSDGDLLPGVVLNESRPLSLIAEWVRGGPPGPPPAPPAPAAVIAEDHLAAAATRVRGISGEALAALRAELDDQVVAALELDGWTVLFCPCHRPPPGTFQEDRIVLVDPDGAAVTILMSDPWNGHVMPIDGDAALFRVVAKFWRDLIARAGLDLAFILPRLIEDDDDDDDDDDTDDEDEADDASDGRTTLLEWLEFPLPSRGSLRFPAIDWRVHGDGEEGDFIAEFSFWADGPFAMPPETRAEYEAAIASHWHPFIRAVIDPSFPRTA